ncbi:hypothetical protein HYS54_04550 [Candidatus Micrarchaeota archaeon]|nr:hypothetical protein [Candidatus Micrarchaeota archaeon]
MDLKLLLAFAMVLSLALVGCTSPEPPRKPAGELPDLVVMEAYVTHYLEHDNTTKQYKETHSFTTSVPPETRPSDWADMPVENAKVKVFKGSIFVAAKDGKRIGGEFTEENTIIKLNSQLEKKAEVKLADLGFFGTLVASHDALFASYGGKLVALDNDLNQLSSVTLSGEMKKFAHDIIVYQDTAYVVDDVWEPILSFRVDVSNPSNMRVKETIDMGGVNSHAGPQWLNPELDQWVVARSWSVISGSSQSLYFYPLASGTEPRASKEVYTYNRPIGEDTAASKSGLRVLAATELAPAWVTIAKEDGVYVALADTTGDSISFTKQLRLSEGAEYPSIKKSGNKLFILLSNSLKVVDISGDPAVVMSQDFNQTYIDFDLITGQ